MYAFVVYPVKGWRVLLLSVRDGADEPTQRTLHTDRTGGDLFIFTHLLVEEHLEHLGALGGVRFCYWCISRVSAPIRVGPGKPKQRCARSAERARCHGERVCFLKTEGRP